jgi:predicted nucleic acid-binding protein
MIVVDTGPLVAAADADDKHHDACSRLLLTSPETLIVPVAVVVEVGYLLERNLGPKAEASFLRTLSAGGLPVEQTTQDDFDRAAELIETYADLRLGTVDALVVATAERLRATRIATIDRRHFSVVRPSHVDAFELLP